jgi:hypothetical protein
MMIAMDTNSELTFFVPSNAIHIEEALEIAAPPEQAAAIYRDVDHWGKIFPATIESAQVVKTGDGWRQIDVVHKQEGCVPNTLYDLSETEIGLRESKQKFDASFLNCFEPAPGGRTRYVIHGYVSPKGIYRLLKPFLIGYVQRQMHRQMCQYVLEPLKTAAERSPLGI